jgi:hypothetical protein
MLEAYNPCAIADPDGKKGRNENGTVHSLQNASSSSSFVQEPVCLFVNRPIYSRI